MTAPFSWLEDVVKTAASPGGGGPELGPTTSPEDAWREMADHAGLSISQLEALVADHFGLAVADLELAEPTARTFVPDWVALEHQVLPLRAGYGKIFVATSDPTNLDAEQDITFAAGRGVAFEVLAPAALTNAINAMYAPDREVETVLDSFGDLPDTAISVVDAEEAQELSVEDVQTAPVIRLTNLLLIDAIQQGASDIHFQPKGGGGVVRFRLDGVLRDHTRLPLSALNRVVSRVKVMASLDITNRLRPQDGRSQVKVGVNFYDLRISTIPTREAEKAVIRILDPEGAARGLDKLGLL